MKITNKDDFRARRRMMQTRLRIWRMQARAAAAHMHAAKGK